MWMLVPVKVQAFFFLNITQSINNKMNHRIFVEKYPKFQVEALSLKNELNTNLALEIKQLRLINVYDLFNFSPELVEKAKYRVFGEVVTDNVTDDIQLTNKKYIAIESLPGQFDQRASSAVDCVGLIDPEADIQIKAAKIIILDDDTSDNDILRIKKYCINTVESREKNLELLDALEQPEIQPVTILDGFRNIPQNEYAKYCRDNGLAMNADDLACVIEYFRNENRDPYETELRILDTYWSDHCRHTTFTSVLEEITIDESFIKSEMQDSLELYENMRRSLGREHKDRCLMDMACIGARYLKSQGHLNDLEESEENNACSIYVNVDVDGINERWLLQFKNETHNHPTEIEPFGGASTCLGGAIRDPLSGRAYVYQAMRVTGAADIYRPIADTIPGKLPQRIISTKAAAGYSSYGNQIGLATTHVRELYHPNYVAKRMEVGAVVGAVKAKDVRRESPLPGDIVMMFGGRTGRDGVGGATGSSKEHTEQSLESCSSEVQKGNAPEERKLERLFRRPEVTRLIKKSNDFGAGGVSVAIGELTDGLDIYLDRVTTKYSGLNATELAISESQERISVVISPSDKAEFIAYCESENIEVVHVADVTDTNRMRMYYRGRTIVDLSRDFIDSAGALHYAKAQIQAVENINPFSRSPKGDDLKHQILNVLADDNVLSQKGLIEMFDATIGLSTVLMPFGGRTQRTETQVSVQKLPILSGFTNTASMMAFGFNPDIASWSPYHAAAYSVIEACAKVVAAGAPFDGMRFSYQEYFERMTDDAHSWGKPLAALLGALKMQDALKLPSIGGKDSMSGTFQDINVPPMLMAFGINTVDARNVISPEFKKPGSYIYIVAHNHLDNYMPDTDQLAKNWRFVTSQIEAKNIISAYAIGFGGITEAIAKMSFGNNIGAHIVADNIFDLNYGSIIIESPVELHSLNILDVNNLVLIGRTYSDAKVEINGVAISIDELYRANTEKYESVYPASVPQAAMPPIDMNTSTPSPVISKNSDSIVSPVVFIPVFPGTNCDYDTSRAFTRAGARVVSSVFCNLNNKAIHRSISEICDNINNCNILALAGGFSAGDEPDGSAKFIANVLNNDAVKSAVHNLIDRGGLILGICNGFQALVKSGLLPYGRLGMVTKDSPTLFRNDINRHISQMVSTRVSTLNSPWLSSFSLGESHTIAMSHGEGKFVVSEELAQQLFAKGQVAFQYIDDNDTVTMQSPYNPNGSSFAIEGIISENGQILGKMGHSERYEQNLFKNISGNRHQSIFENAVRHFQNK